MARRICLFDIDGTLTKPRNVTLSHQENRCVYERNSSSFEKDNGCGVCWRQ